MEQQEQSKNPLLADEIGQFNFPKKVVYDEKEMFELEQELDISSHLRWHNSKPKQETLEEAAEFEASLFYRKGSLDWNKYRQVFIEGAKWQQERSYSEEEVLRFSEWIVFEVEHYGCPTEENIIRALKEIKRILKSEQFKNK